jgi:gliding motility-associated-like protein
MACFYPSSVRAFFIFLFCFFSAGTFAQGNMISITSNVPSEMTVCAPAQTFSIEIYNPSPNNLTDVVLTVTMPDGILYEPGSIQGGTEFNITDLSNPVFELSDLPTLNKLSVEFEASVSCDIIAFVAGGNLTENLVHVDYNTGNFTTYDEHTTGLYSIRQPNLSITSVSNQTYSGSVGDVFTRCITISNGGLGSLSEFLFTENHGNGIQINNVDVGNWTNQGLTEEIILSGADFTQIGNNDTLFDSGEQIVICQTVEVVNCISVASDYEAGWGCFSQVCQFSNSSANVVFPNLTPNLSVSHTSSMNSCLGPATPSPQSITLENIGQGDAVDVILDIFQANSANHTTGLRSRIDENSFTIQFGSGPVDPLTPSSTSNNAAHSCLDPNPKSRAFLDIPIIPAGETVVIRWNSYSCCRTTCGGGNGGRDINGWKFTGSYSNICENDYSIATRLGRNDSRLYGDLANNGSPASMSAGQTEEFSFVHTNYGNSYPAGPGRHWKYVVTLPPCVVYAGNMRIVNRNGVSVWNASSVTSNGNQITAIFNGSHPWTLYQSELNFDLTVDCNSCASGGSGNVQVESFYVPNGSCGCDVAVGCQNSQLSVVCPQTCEGMTIASFNMERTSYGDADNDNDGLPDANPNNLDFSLIRTDRAMFGDTLSSEFKGAVNTSANNPNWEFAYASSSISNGNRVSFLDAELIIKRGAQTFTCTDFTPVVTNTGTTRNFDYDLSVAGLIAEGCVPGGFRYQQGDSVIFTPRYEITSNPGGNVLECDVINDFYLSPIANPTNAADQFSCNQYRGNFSIVGYYFTNWGPNDYNIDACDDITVSQNYYLSIGPCCQNYAGGNFFPYEYRYWAHIQSLDVQAPAGYQFQSARFNQRRTAGTGPTNLHPWIAINPVDPNASRLEFEVEQYYEAFGGTIPFSDDGFYGTIQVTYSPSCSVVPNVESNVGYYWTFGESDFLIGSNTAPTRNVTTHDYITYQGPELQLQSTLPSVLAPNRLAEWEISVSNITSSDALNTWISAPNMNGITIEEVYDLDNNQVIPANGEIYQIGTSSASTTRNFRIRASYTSCNPADIVLHTGWNCNDGYPVDVASYPCNTESITLSLTPQSPTLIANVTSPPTSVDLCDTATYFVEGENIQLGTAYDLTLTVVLPVGVTIVPGSAEMEYPLGNGMNTIPDPVFLGGTMYEWDLSSYDLQLDTNGMKGLLSQALNKVNLRFQIETGCDYISGSLIGFNFQGVSACGQTTGQEITLSSQLAISGAQEPYFTDVDLTTTYISPCNDPSEMKVDVVNTGPLDFGTTDSIYIDLPEGVTYIPNSFSGTYNAPPHANPTISFLNNRQKLAWALPPGTTVNDSVVFTFDYEGAPENLSCAISDFDANTISSKNVLCVISNQPCDIRVVTGSANLPVYTYKANLLFSASSAVASPVSASTEQVDFDLTIDNFGQTINAGNETILNYYHDSDGSGNYTPGDQLLVRDTITQQIPNGGSIQHTASHTLNVGETCPIIVRVDPQQSSCACNATETLINDIPLLNAGRDTAVCSGESFQMGFQNINGYTYSWSPTAGLDDPNIANPVFSMVNSTTTPDTNIYILTTDKGLCTSIDSMTVIVNPLPTVSFSGLDAEYCVNEPSVTLTGSPLGGFFTGDGINGNDFSPATAGAGTHLIYYTYTDNNGCTDTSQQQVIVHPLPVINVASFGNICLDADPLVLNQGTPVGGTYFGTGVNAGEFDPSVAGLGTHMIYYTYTDNNSCADTSSNTIEVRPLPEITLDTIINVTCFSLQNAEIQISVSNGNQPYSFQWSNNDQNEDLANVGAGNYYVIVSDQYGCEDSVNYDITEPDSLIGSASILQYPGGNNVSCENAEDGQVDVVAVGGTPPYNYDWSNNDVGIPLTNIGAGTYTLSITDIYNCIDTLQVTLTEPDTLVSTLSALTYIGGNNISCYSAADGEITPTVNGGIHPYFYDWSNNETDSVINGLIAGTYTVTITDTNGCETQNSITLTEPDSLEIDTTIGIVHCLGGSDGSIELIPSGGIAPYTYNWSNGETTQIIDSLSAGFYDATVTDENGCEQYLSVELEDGYQLETEMDPVNVSCHNFADAEAEVTPTNGLAPYDYLWSNNAQAALISPIDTGTYTVLVTDANDCEAYDTVRITQPDSLLGTATLLQYPGGNNVSCENAEDGQVDIATTGGTLPYSYNWSNNDVGIPLENVGAGNYTLSITDSNNCLYTVDVTLTKPDTLVSTLSALTYIGGNNISCYSAADGEITPTVNGGIHPYFYDWSNNETDSVINGLIAGTYTVTITDTNGCETQNSITLTEPDSLEIDTIIGIVHCLGGSDGSIDLIPSGGIAPYDYLWSTNETTSGISDLNAGFYSATVTDENGCEQYITVELEDGYQLETEMDSVNVSCHNFADAEAEVTPTNGLAPYDYAWSNNVQTALISPIDTGTYTVLVTDANDCEANDTVRITQPDSLLSEISGMDVTCFDGSDGEAYVTAQGGTEPYLYEWTVDGASAEVSGLPIGTYSVTITDAQGCKSYETIEIEQPLPIWVVTDTPVYEISLGDEVEIITDYFANGRSIATYEWTPSDGLDCDFCETTFASPIEETLYTLEITDDSGCKTDTSFIVKIKPDKVFYIPTAFSPNGDGNNDEFRVYALGVEDFLLQIHDRWGNLVFETRDIDEGWDGTYRGQKAESDVYVYRVYADFLDKDLIRKKGSLTLLR